MIKNLTKAIKDYNNRIKESDVMDKPKKLVELINGLEYLDKNDKLLRGFISKCIEKYPMNLSKIRNADAFDTWWYKIRIHTKETLEQKYYVYVPYKPLKKLTVGDLTSIDPLFHEAGSLNRVELLGNEFIQYDHSTSYDDVCDALWDLLPKKVHNLFKRLGADVYWK